LRAILLRAACPLPPRHFALARLSPRLPAMSRMRDRQCVDFTPNFRRIDRNFQFSDCHGKCVYTKTVTAKRVTRFFTDGLQ
jgi:hypothetical protein